MAHELVCRKAGRMFQGAGRLWIEGAHSGCLEGEKRESWTWIGGEKKGPSKFLGTGEDVRLWRPGCWPPAQVWL